MTPALLNVPRTDNEWAIWSFANAQDHEDIIQAIRKANGPSLAVYPLDPIGPAFEDYLRRNQQSHTDMELDPTDIRQLTAWIRDHHQEHYDARAALGI